MEENLTIREKSRYKNQILLNEIGTKGQEKLKNASVVVIGAGGLGTVTLQQLSASGVGHLGIADNDMVEESNIHRQTLYGSADLGKQKAIIVKQKLSAQHPYIDYKVHNLCISMNNIETICENYDIVVDATDYVESNKLIDEHCKLMKKPVVYGKINGYTGKVSVFHYRNGYSLSMMKNRPLENKNNGFLSLVASIIGGFMTFQAIKIIVGIENVLDGKVLEIDTFNSKAKLYDI